MTKELSQENHSTDKCYLEYVEGYLTCTFNHKIGEECLMSPIEEVTDKVKTV